MSFHARLFLLLVVRLLVEDPIDNEMDRNLELKSGGILLLHTGRRIRSVPPWYLAVMFFLVESVLCLPDLLLNSTPYRVPRYTPIEVGLKGEALEGGTRRSRGSNTGRRRGIGEEERTLLLVLLVVVLVEGVASPSEYPSV